MKKIYLLVPLSPLINLFAITYCFFHPKLTSSVDPYYLACSNPKVKTCGDGQNIGYPFYIQDKQDPFCGYPGFNLTCNDKGQPILRLENTNYVVQNIYYDNQSLRVSSAAVLDTNSTSCLPPIQNLSLPEDGFRLATNQKELLLLYNCNSTLLYLNDTSGVLLKDQANCSEESTTGSTLAVFEDDPLLDNVSGKCGNVVAVPVDVDEGEITNQGVKGLLERGFLLDWLASNCSTCEASGGKCGFIDSIYNFRCFCPDQPHASQCSPEKKKLALRLGLASAVVAMGVALITLWYIRRKVSSTNSYVDCWNKKTQVDRSIDAFLRDHVRLMQKRYSYSEIKKMTESFRVKLGQGGYGSVFKGKFPDGRLVAVKVLKESKTSSEEFINEVATISRTSHVNIVALLGYCFEGSKRALIYEFMSNGSLEKYIHQDLSKENHQFGYEVLHQIALGIAIGLEYLHRGCNTRILHFDIKPHNILLDENFSPKISDFGLAKICLQRENIISMSGARGTAGYIAPEVFCRNFGGVSHKSDVYSYGMMVLEMIGGRKNVQLEVDNTSEKYFPDWIYKHLEHGAELGLYAMRSEDENQLARRMIIVSLWCIQTKPSDRPPMSRVIEMLQGSFEPLDIPPRPYLFSASRSPQRSEAISSATLLCESKEELIGSLPA